MRDMLKEIARKTLLRTGTTILYADDYLDNGAKICLHVNIDIEVNTCTMKSYIFVGMKVLSFLKTYKSVGR